MCKRMVFVLLMALVLGCEAKPDLSAPLTYDDDGVTFKYPGNWKVTDDSRQAIEGVEFATIMVESPGSALATISVFYGGRDLDITAESFSQDIEEGRVEKMEKIMGAAKSLAKVSATKVSRAPSRAKASTEEQIVHNFSISAVGESVPYRGEFHRFIGEGSLAISYFRVPEEDRAKVDPGFALIYDTLRAK